MTVRVVVAIGLLLAAASLRADYRQEYLDGLRALERGEIARAIAALSAAAAERPAEQARARLVGAIPQPYVPHHFLAIAYARAGRCAEALAAFEVSRAQGVAPTVPNLKEEAERWASLCAPPPEPSDAARSAPPVPEVVLPAEPSRSTDGAAEPPASAAGSADPPSGGKEALPPRAPVPTRSPAPWPPALVAAASAYLAADHSAALGALAGRFWNETEEPGVAFAGHLIAAASSFALAALGEAERTAAARDSVLAARRLRPDYRPSIEFFSPRFVAFYRETRP